jgi:hypothetical protein
MLSSNARPMEIIFLQRKELLIKVKRLLFLFITNISACFNWYNYGYCCPKELGAGHCMQKMFVVKSCLSHEQSDIFGVLNCMVM